MKATIERVSRFGVMVDGVWRNLSKFDPVDLTGFNAGDEVEIELKKDKFITKLEHLNGETKSTKVAKEDTEVSGQATETNHKQRASHKDPSDGRQEMITRQSAYNAVLGSPWLGEFYKSMDYSQAVSEALTLVDKLATYAQKGNPVNN